MMTDERMAVAKQVHKPDNAVPLNTRRNKKPRISKPTKASNRKATGSRQNVDGVTQVDTVAGSPQVANHDNQTDVNGSRQQLDPDKQNYVKAWLNATHQTPEPARIDGSVLQPELEVVPSITYNIAKFPRPNLSTGSTESEASAARRYYRKVLWDWNIYIHCKEPSARLEQRARAIISRRRSEPEVTDKDAALVKNQSRAVEGGSGRGIEDPLGPMVLPRMLSLPSRRLASVLFQPWSNFIPLPQKRSVRTIHLPMTWPRTDRAFGYSAAAFNKRQLAAINLFWDDRGRSYSMPHPQLRFPFLAVEFEAQAAGGTHFLAANKLAKTGAVAVNNLMELARRAGSPQAFSAEEPMFFSVSMDHQTVCLNMHWTCWDKTEQQDSFQMENLMCVSIQEVEGLRAIQRAVKNILDWALRDHLPKIRALLDTCPEKPKKAD